MTLSFYIKNFFGKKLEIVNRKGFYAYKYIDSFKKIKEGLPEESKFYNF